VCVCVYLGRGVATIVLSRGATLLHFLSSERDHSSISQTGMWRFNACFLGL